MPYKSKQSRQHYSTEFKRKVVNSFYEARNKIKYCEENGLSYATVMSWVRKYKALDTAEKLRPSIIEPPAITGDIGFKATHKFKMTDGQLEDPNEEEFCRLFVFDTPQFNALNSYIKAYNVTIKNSDQYEYYMNMANQLLNEPAISIRITKLVANHIIMTHQVADAMVAMLMMQNEDKNVKLKAIDMYNRLNRRYDVPEHDRQQVDGRAIINRLLGSD